MYHRLGEQRRQEQLGPLLLLLVGHDAFVVDLGVLQHCPRDVEREVDDERHEEDLKKEIEVRPQLVSYHQSNVNCSQILSIDHPIMGRFG